MQTQPTPPSGQVQIKIDDQVLKGVYANALQIGHTKEEFVLDFMNLLPPQGIAVARVLLSPGHMKRILAALEDNIKKYEEQFGKIEVAQDPEKNQSLGFTAK